MFAASSSGFGEKTMLVATCGELGSHCTKFALACGEHHGISSNLRRTSCCFPHGSQRTFCTSITINTPLRHLNHHKPSFTKDSLSLSLFLSSKLYAILIDEGNGSEAGSQSGGGVSRNIRRLMVDLNRLPEGSSEGSILDSNTPMAEILDSHDESVVGDLATHDYVLNRDSDNDQEDNEPEVVAQGEEDDEEEEDEVEEQ
ncbi:hypothetical protein PIB30_002899 [Stylosanthes scabra]|uniref:Uncharacterized protein n=1 Tax=Stylosanthes scabra TaxID=79078 RepID=A0ABU6U4T1_9FABA|nr:hypothetical protein [Stylosanthes scabra]